MKIGLDLTSLQGPHRQRGIGYTLINLMNNLSEETKQRHDFIFFFDNDDTAPNPLDLLDLEGVRYEIRAITKPRQQSGKKIFPHKLNVLFRLLNKLTSALFGSYSDARITNTGEIDVFLQTDQMTPLPSGGMFQKTFIAYDLIPYVLEWDYLWNYHTARNHGLPLQAAIRCQGRRWLYLRKVRKNVEAADKILSISETTTQDFKHYIPASSGKIFTVPLGVNTPRKFSSGHPITHHYVSSSWGYIQRPYKFNSDIPFLLFVGGADKRRKLEDLVTAFNHLRGQGIELKLVLAGDSMRGPTTISTEVIQHALLDTSYIEDIVFLGFVDDQQRDWLYKHALAFVFPSRYEGFGLPVLEAFTYDTPVISYKNSATIEVAGDAATYANDVPSLINAIKHHLVLGAATQEKQSLLRKQQVDQYSWKDTSERVFRELESIQ